MEEQLIDKRRCECNLDSNLHERNITDFPTGNDEVVKIVKYSSSEYVTVTKVLVKVGTEMEQTLIPLEDKVSIEYRDNVKIMSFFNNGPTLSLTLDMYFKGNFKGLGNGRGECGPPHHILDEDCVDRDTFLNQCFMKCPNIHPTIHSTGVWYWEKARCGECGNPPC
ncbi:hypothetical protein [Priestia endophytica]|uniref:hypothetical protein n=1 Tax=Priestia endophytica TaxID=135735 RepID=UPI00124D7265|nr:hypothetical protein [Priestia endophytica]KAB2489625.1 hypothetical protein F8155_23095 [Priestia endophytica]